MRPILFLDFDGVVSRDQPLVGPLLSGPARLIPEAVRWLNVIVARTRCEVVVSSTWRSLGAPMLLGWLRGAGYNHSLRGVTPSSEGRDRTVDDIEAHRGGEMLAWRRAHAPRASYVVLDDLALRGPVSKRLVQVTTGHLQDEHVERVVAMLRRRSTTIPATAA